MKPTFVAQVRRNVWSRRHARLVGQVRLFLDGQGPTAYTLALMPRGQMVLVCGPHTAG